MYENEATYAVDLNRNTKAKTGRDQDGNAWLRLTFEVMHCVSEFIWYDTDTSIIQTWTCSDSQYTCSGGGCNGYSLTVSTAGAAPAGAAPAGVAPAGAAPENLPPVTDCKYGDTVQLNYNGNKFWVFEMAVVGKQGW